MNVFQQVKRKLESFLTGKKTSDYFLENFRTHSEVKAIRKSSGNLLHIDLDNFDREILARNYPHSDVNVLVQIFIEEEYKPVVDYVKHNFGNRDDLQIIDAGANVGYFSLYMKKFFPAANIACIEPDANNMKVLIRNLQNYIVAGEVHPYLNGLGPVADVSLEVDHSFRGGKDWSLAVKESVNTTNLKSIAIRNIIDDNKEDIIDILKIDIEGSERFVFNKNADISFLDNVKLICLEIHDEFNVRESIYEILTGKDFVISNFGETTMATNKKLM